MRLRRLFSLTVVVGLLSVMMAQIALAAPPEDVIEDEGLVATCGKGSADSPHQSEWELLDVERLTELYGGTEGARAAAERTFAKCDHNRDDLACTKTQNLPNDSSGSDTWFLSEDNHYAPSK